MDMRMNAGYIITSSVHIGESEFVLGVNRKAPGQFVTWKCSGGSDYYWGHYFSDQFAAEKDLVACAQEEIQYLEERNELSEKQKHPKEKATHEYAEDLPEKCFSVLRSTGALIILERGKMGYTPANAKAEGMTSREGADIANETMGVTKAQEAAMVAGSMFGWHTPAADPKNYDETGKPIKPKQKDRGDER